MPTVSGRIEVGRLDSAAPSVRRLKHCGVTVRKLQTGSGAGPSHTTDSSGHAIWNVPARSTFESAGETWTDDNGDFSVSVTAANEDLVQVVVRLEHQEEHTAIWHAVDQTWEIPDPPDGALRADGAANLQILITEDHATGHGGDSRLAAQMYDLVLRQRAWFTDQGLSAPRNCRILYPSSNARDAFCDPGRVGSLIRLGTREAGHASTIAHEYGHHLYWSARTDGFATAILAEQSDLAGPSAASGEHVAYGLASATQGFLDDCRHWEDVAAVPDDIPAWSQNMKAQLHLDFIEGLATFIGQSFLDETTYTDAHGSFDLDGIRSSADGYGDAPTAGYLWELREAIRNGHAHLRGLVYPFAEVFRESFPSAVKTIGDLHERMQTRFPEVAATALAASRVTRQVRYTSAWLESPTPFTTAAATS